MASAASVDVSWQNSGIGTTSSPSGDLIVPIVADIVITVGVYDTPLVGEGASIRSSDAVESGTLEIFGASQTTLDGRPLPPRCWHSACWA